MIDVLTVDHGLGRMSRVLFVSHAASQCGVYMFGREIFEQLATSSRLDMSYVECQRPKHFVDAISAYKPDVIILNQHAATMPWAECVSSVLCNLPCIGIVHDATSEMANQWEGPVFDVLVTHDPDLETTNSRFMSAPRPIPMYRASSTPPKE